MEEIVRSSTQRIGEIIMKINSMTGNCGLIDGNINHRLKTKKNNAGYICFD